LVLGVLTEGDYCLWEGHYKRGRVACGVRDIIRGRLSTVTHNRLMLSRENFD
jgi:hypothetical protein